MLQSEFEKRVGMTVTAAEYDKIEDIYLNSDVDKDEFCKLWARMNYKRIATYKAEQKAQERAQKVKEILREVWNKYAFKDYMWKVQMLNHTILNKREEKALEEAGIDLRYYSYDAGGYLYYNMRDTLNGIGQFLGFY